LFERMGGGGGGRTGERVCFFLIKLAN
jgi:hypothetical protein